MKINSKFLDIFAGIGSSLFSSPIVTTICTLLVISKTEYFGLILSSIFFYTFLPILTYAFLKNKGLITDKRFDFNIRKREERTIYNIIVVLGFLTNFLVINMYSIPIAREISLLIFLSFLIFALITLFWKISGHMTQTVLIITTLAFFFSDYRFYILLLGYLFFVPWVGWSRVYNRHHTLAQVFAGTLVTSLLAYIVFTIA